MAGVKKKAAKKSAKKAATRKKAAKRKTADKKKPGKTTPKAKIAVFVKVYLTTWNATKAAISAGYSEKTAYSIGHELLKKPEVQEAIDKALAVIENETEITVEFVVKEIVSTYRAARLANNFNAAARCLELMGKYKKMFTDKFEVEAGQTLESIIAKSMKSA